MGSLCKFVSLEILENKILENKTNSHENFNDDNDDNNSDVDNNENNNNNMMMMMMMMIGLLITMVVGTNATSRLVISVPYT